MRLRFLKLSPVLILLFAFALMTATSAQDATPAGTIVPTVQPTSQFDFNLAPTPVFGTATPLPSLSGVGGRAVNGAVAIRSGPGLEYQRIGALARGRSIDIIGYNGYDLNRTCSPNFQADLDMWVMVRFRERIGWMARCALEIRGEQNMAYMINNVPPQGAMPPTGYPVTGTPRSGG
jgi:uncharacterized protein YraI